MSSIKFDSNANTEDVLNMTAQWGYKPARVSQKPEPASSENEIFSTVLQAWKPVVNSVLMMAGAATALAILISIAWLSGILQIPA